MICDCLHSICQHHPTFSFEIIIIDNSNDLEGKQRILNYFPLVQWIEMGYNAGFARANNAGIKAAKGSTYLLLNPDTLALDNSIALCYDLLVRGEYIAAGVQLLDADHRPQISGSHFMKGGLNHLLPIPYWGALLRWLGYRAGKKVPGVQQANAMEEVDWISGAFLMVKRGAVEKAGLLDEDFFLYAEEVEWCSRLKKAGKLVIFGDLKIVHLEGATINKSQNTDERGYYNLYDKKGLQLMVSNHLRVRKQYGIGWFLFLLLNYSFGIIVFCVAGFFHRLLTGRNPFSHGGKVGAFAVNVARLWMLTPKIISNRPFFYKMF
jgi:hypothetical protein